MKRVRLFVAAAFVPAIAFAASPLDIQESVLDNGFRLLVVEDHRVSRVAASLWYRFGSMQEPAGEHGAAHFLEHVIHQGTTTVGTTDFHAELPILQEIYETEQKLLEERRRARNQLRIREVFYDELDWPSTTAIETLRKKLYALEDRQTPHRVFWEEYNWYRRYGALSRHEDPVPASTEQEYLEITVELPKEAIGLFFRQEAERMVNAVLRGWEAQRFTVLEQILNGLSRPETRLNHAIDGVTALAHPVYTPDGGHPRDFASFNRESMIRMYEDYFVPNNATLVLVGDIDAETARSLAERYFGIIERGPEPPARLDLEAEPVPRSSIRLDWEEPLYPSIVLRYRIPGVGHPDRPALDTIAALAQGRHGLLSNPLIGQGLASSVGADFRVIHIYRFGTPAAINFVAAATSDEALPATERAMLEAIEELRAGHLEPALLERARLSLRLEWEQTRADRLELAFTIGHFQSMDAWKTLSEYMARRLDVSADDIARVARRYFVSSNRVIATTRSDPGKASSP